MEISPSVNLNPTSNNFKDKKIVGTFVTQTYFNHFIYVEFLASTISAGASKSNGDRVSKTEMRM